jgi:hypothetical protein
VTGIFYNSLTNFQMTLQKIKLNNGN